MIRTHFGLRLSLGGGGVGTNGVAITLGDLIFYGLGTVITIDDATYLKAFRPVGNSDVAQVKGTSVLFDGTGYGTFTSPDTGAATSVLLPSTDWDEPIEFWFASGSVVAQETLLAGETTSTNEIVIRVSTNGQIATFFYLGAVFTGYMATVGIYDNALPHRVSLDYQGGIAYLTVDSEIVSAAWTLNGSQNVGFVGRRSDGVDPSTSTNMWGLSGPGFNLNVACGTDLIHPTVELSALLGGPNITWSGFASTIYREWSNGYGFDLNAMGWTIADGSTMYLEATHTTLLTAGSRIPPGAGFDGSGDALVTQNVGPIAANMKTVGISCIVGDATGEVTVTGLLTTDVITVPSGSSLPTCTVNGTMNFVNGEKYYHITVTRAGTLWAFFPCESGEGNLEDTIGGNTGILTGFAAPWTGWTRDFGECLMCKNGFTPNRLGVGTGISVCNSDGLHRDGSSPTYPRNTMKNALNAPVLRIGALGPETQAVTGGTQVDLTTLPFNTMNQIFICNNGMALYGSAQSTENILNIGYALCSHTFPFVFPFILG